MFTHSIHTRLLHNADYQMDGFVDGVEGPFLLKVLTLYFGQFLVNSIFPIFSYFFPKYILFVFCMLLVFATGRHWASTSSGLGS
ncbi:hypothetical protein Hdeb2414_s0008g00296911 [Helianthus debilis subsp. tardiflorus]